MKFETNQVVKKISNATYRMLNLLKSDQNIEKLAALFTELPQNFCHDFISTNLVAAIIEKGKDVTSLIDFGSSFNVDFNWSIENFWTQLRPVSDGLIIHKGVGSYLG